MVSKGVPTVAIQGHKASFHEFAAQKFFGVDIHTKNCDTFAEVFDQSKYCDYGVVAIENSLYGSISDVYDLLLAHSTEICGEVYLRISQNLICLQGAELGDINEVYSHPVALAQCEQFLDEKLPRADRHEFSDTAASVSAIKSWNDKAKAAIASVAAAELHGLKVLVKNIETNKHNFTRFVVICRRGGAPLKRTNKTSIVLITEGDTRPGALYNALGAFAERGIDLTMLQSRPVIGKAWKYQFYMDLSIGESEQVFQDALAELAQHGCEVKILGSYLSGEPAQLEN